MDLDLFYYNLLSPNQQKIYVHLLTHFLEKRGLPYIIPIKLAKEQELLKIYDAVFFDNTSMLLPPRNTIDCLMDGDKCMLISEAEYEIADEKELEEIVDTSREKINKYSNSIFDKIIYVGRLLAKRTCYYLKNNGEGENIDTTLLKHRGYCTGIARTVRTLLSNEVVCVMVFLKKEFSIERMVKRQQSA